MAAIKKCPKIFKKRQKNDQGKWPKNDQINMLNYRLLQKSHNIYINWINIESTLNQHWINIESTLNQHWINIESTLNQHWINIESTLNQHWINIESTLNRHWIDIESTLNRHWIDIESTLNRHWIDIESTLNRHWIDIESTLNRHWIDIESTLNRHWIDIESTLNRHWIDIESTLNQHWINIESTLNQHWINIESTFLKVSTCFNMCQPRIRLITAQCLAECLRQLQLAWVCEPSKGHSLHEKNFKNMEKKSDAFVRKIIWNDMKCCFIWWLFDVYLMSICLFVS